MDGARDVGGGYERHARWLALAGREPVPCDQPRAAASPLERVRNEPVQVASAGPGDPRVDRFPDQRVPEGAGPGRRLLDQAHGDRLVDLAGGAELREHVEFEPKPGYGGDVQRGQRSGVQLLQPHEHGVPHRVGKRNLLTGAELDSFGDRP